MCDWCSWIEKDGKIFFLRDDDIAAKWPEANVRDKIVHSAIEEFYPESKGGKHCESPTRIPKEIAAEVGRGRMDAMAKAGGWAGARYSKAGVLNSPWWKKVKAVIEEVKSIKYFSNSGEINSDWEIFDTRDSARDAAWDAAVDSAGNAAWDAAVGAARDAAVDSARDAALLARCEVVEFPNDNQFKIHAQKRMDVWRAGYGLLCDVNGMLYVYKKL